MTGYSSDSERRKLQREQCNHDLLKSEVEYVDMLDTIVKYIVKPLEQNAERCKIKPKHAKFVFVFLEHMLQFHMNFLSVIRDTISVVPDFYKYCNFVRMYEDYLKRYDEILKIFGTWKSMEFREFVRLRLQNEQVLKYIQSPQLSTLPWYLYRPFDRVKEYYRFLKDLERLSKSKDEDKEFLKKSIQRFKPVYKKIKQNEERLQTKTRLLEVQLQIHGDHPMLVQDHRFFIFQKPCQMERKMNLGKKYKRVTIYVFNDLLVWASARGRYKGGFSFQDTQLKIIKSTKEDNAFELSTVLDGNKVKKKKILCVNKTQCEKIMNKISDIQQKCKKAMESKSPEERQKIIQKVKTETNLMPEFSQSSMEDSYNVRESSISMNSMSDIPRANGKSLQNNNSELNGLGKISEHEPTDVNLYNNNKSNGKHLSPNFKHKPLGIHNNNNNGNNNTSKNVYIPVNGNSKLKYNDNSDDSSDKNSNSSNSKIIKNSNSNSSNNKKRNSKEDIDNSNIITDDDDIKENKLNGYHNNNNKHKHKHKHKHRHHNKQHIVDEQNKVIKDLREQLQLKENQVKTLEKSNETIRKTLFNTRTQLAKAQQEKAELQQIINKMNHRKTHSLAMGDLRRVKSHFTKLRSPNNGEVSSVNKTVNGFRRSSSHVGIKYFGKSSVNE